jgi:hypothetical protein
MVRILIILMCLIFIAQPVHADIRCEIQKKSLCTLNECLSVETDEYKMFRPPNTYTICIKNQETRGQYQCQNTQVYADEVKTHKGFLFIPFIGGLAKIAVMDMETLGLKRGDFVELRAVLTGVFSSFGRCNLSDP